MGLNQNSLAAGLDTEIMSWGWGRVPAFTNLFERVFMQMNLIMASSVESVISIS